MSNASDDLLAATALYACGPIAIAKAMLQLENVSLHHENIAMKAILRLKEIGADYADLAEELANYPEKKDGR